MPRSGRLRCYIKEFAESPRFEKLSFIPPFLVLIVEIILLRHALSINEGYVIALTSILLILSAVEIFLVGGEIHDHYRRTNFDRILTIRLDDFITKKRNKNVQSLVEEFIETYPGYSCNRNEIYHIACQILDTHKEEAIESKVEKTLTPFFKKNKDKNVDDILSEFIKKYPNYKKYSSEIYEKICQLKVQTK